MYFTAAPKNCRCAETGKPIKKGDLVLYWEGKYFHYDSPSAHATERELEELKFINSKTGGNSINAAF
jgi:hypothetical protein